MGRDKELDVLRNFLHKEKSSSPNCCAIYGMPGIGKSQLVLHYSKISFDLRQYSHIFWISAASVSKLNQGFAKILDLIGHRDRFQQDHGTKLTAAQLWLEEPHGDGGTDWLLVFDNVDKSTLGFFRTHLPRTNARGHILFTTRTMDVADALIAAARCQHSTLKLKALGPRDAANLLLEEAGIETENVTPFLLSHAKELVACVGRLPLAIVQAASFMKQTRTGLDDMVGWYKNEREIEVSPHC
jgi:hypothetical protein